MGKENFAVIGVTLSFISYLPYLWSVARRRTIPHAFSWIIWGVLSAIGAAVQLASGSGSGAWTTCSSAVFCLLVAALAAFKGGFHATRADWITFICGMGAIPIWYVTGNPLWALLLLITIEGTAFGLTIKKGWYFPHEDMIFCYAVYAMAACAALAAVKTYTIITVGYPVFIIIANILVVLVLVGRRFTKPAGNASAP